MKQSMTSLGFCWKRNVITRSHQANARQRAVSVVTSRASLEVIEVIDKKINVPVNGVK